MRTRPRLAEALYVEIKRGNAGDGGWKRTHSVTLTDSIEIFKCEKKEKRRRKKGRKTIKEENRKENQVQKGRRTKQAKVGANTRMCGILQINRISCWLL